MRSPKTPRGTINTYKDHFSKIQIADKDGDLDRDPYISGAWAPMTLSNGATGTIDWVAAFGLPEIPKLVWLSLSVRDSGSAGGLYGIYLKAKNTTTTSSLVALAERAANDVIRTSDGCVAVADNGTTHYTVVASGVNTMDVWIRVVAWVKA